MNEQKRPIDEQKRPTNTTNTVYLSPISPNSLNTILLTKILFSIQRLVPFLNDLGT